MHCFCMEIMAFDEQWDKSDHIKMANYFSVEITAFDYQWDKSEQIDFGCISKKIL